MPRYLPVLIASALLAAPVIWMWRNSNTQPDSVVEGCWVSDKYGQLEIAGGAISHEGKRRFASYSVAETDGPVELHAKPQFEIFPRKGGKLDFVLVKDGYWADQVIELRRTGGRRELILLAAPYGEEMPFLEAPCAAAA